MNLRAVVSAAPRAGVIARELADSGQVGDLESELYK